MTKSIIVVLGFGTVDYGCDIGVQPDGNKMIVELRDGAPRTLKNFTVTWDADAGTFTLEHAVFRREFTQQQLMQVGGTTMHAGYDHGDPEVRIWGATSLQDATDQFPGSALLDDLAA